MEKVNNDDFIPEVYENDIEMYLDMFAEENNIDSYLTAPQNVFSAALRYVRKHVFPKGNTILKIEGNRYNQYDIEKVIDVLEIYIDICMRYNKEISIMGFCYLTGIDTDTVNSWRIEEGKLSKGSSVIAQKIKENQEESLSGILVTGKVNPVAILGKLNKLFGWNMPGVRENVKREKLVSRDNIQCIDVENVVKLPEVTD